MTGKTRRKTIRGQTSDEVVKKARKVAVAIDEGTYKEPSKMTTAQWLETWHRDFIGNVKLTTRISYEQQIRLHLKPNIGAIRLDKLTAVSIQHLYNKLIATA
jgi:hypothetical protein